MLPPTQHQTRPRTPNLFTTTRTQPLLTALAHKLSSVDRHAMRRPTQTRHRNPPPIANRSINRHSPFRIRHILHWPTHMHHARVVLAHESLVLNTPTRQIGWQRVVPEIDRRLDEIIGQHAAADDARIVVINRRRRARYARANTVENLRRRYAIRPRRRSLI